MPAPEAATLLPLAESIADGSPVDWLAAGAGASAEDREVIRQLQVLAELASLHRSFPGEVPPVEHAFAGRRGSPAPAVGSWAHLDLIEHMGGGTFADVYRAWDRHLEREVALKLLRVDEQVDRLDASPITAEARLLARVRHANVITVYGVAVHESRVGLWMELVRGATLEQVLATSGPFGAREATLVGIDLCRALAAIHKAGLVHRDVKAQNVMREQGGRHVLMDLGTSRELRRAQRYALPDLAGTPLYLAPEIFAGAHASAQTDLYSLGVLLYRLVTVSFPVQATTLDELQAEHAKRRPHPLRGARPDLPTAFVRVIDRATSWNPKERQASFGELEMDLATALDAEPADAPSPVDDFSWGVRRTSLVGLLAAAVVLAVAAGFWYGLSPKRNTPGGVDAIRSLAVLPLANLSGDASQEYFADALTDELISTIGQLGGVNVISHTSVAQFKGTRKRAPEIARALNVDAILEGSVLVTPSADPEPNPQKHVRVNARLIIAGTDTQLWSKTFEHVLTNVLSLQSDVALAVAEEFHLRAAAVPRQAAGATNGANPEAQDAYLHGRSYLDSSSRSRLIEARQWLERATRLDPSLAQAHASLAVCYVWLELVGVLSHDVARSLAVDAAGRALRLNPNLAEAHGALANVQLFDWDWRNAEASYRRALALNGNYTLARRNYAWTLAASGRLTDALAQARAAATADPLSSEAKGALGMMLYFARQYDESIAALRTAVALAPDTAQVHMGLGRAYAAKQAFPEAIREIGEAVRLSGEAPPYVGELARTYAAAGDRERAQDMLSRLEAKSTSGDQYVDPQVLGYVYVALGERNRAFDLLARAIADRTPGIAWAKVDPRVDLLRLDPRFPPLVRQLGLPD